jgi:hypothetical protein
MELYTMVPDEATLAALKRLSDALAPMTLRYQTRGVGARRCTSLLYMGEMFSRNAWS